MLHVDKFTVKKVRSQDQHKVHLAKMLLLLQTSCTITLQQQSKLVLKTITISNNKCGQ